MKSFARHKYRLFFIPSYATFRPLPTANGLWRMPSLHDILVLAEESEKDHVWLRNSFDAHFDHGGPAVGNRGHGKSEIPPQVKRHGNGPIGLNIFSISADNLGDREREMAKVSREEIHKSRNCQRHSFCWRPCA